MDDVDPAIPIGEIHTLADYMALPVAERRIIVSVFLSFGVIALLQAACGIYGTLSYFVSRRTPEIGLRMALGAQRRDVLRMVTRQSVAPVFSGLFLGAVAAPLLTLAMQSSGEILVGTVSAADQIAIIAAVALLGVAAAVALLVVAAAVALLVVAAAVAAWTPAVRATRIDPMRALRHG